MADGFTYDLFLSHNSQDKPRVRGLAERLKQAGLRVWFDEWVIKAATVHAPEAAGGGKRTCSRTRSIAGRGRGVTGFWAEGWPFGCGREVNALGRKPDGACAKTFRHRPSATLMR